MKFIFEVTVKDGYTVEEYAKAWLEASRIIQQTPGARGTWLHRKIGTDDTLLAIAEWDSKQARDAKNDDADEVVRSIMARHARYCDIRVIGEFEEPEWHVPPPNERADTDDGNP